MKDKEKQIEEMAKILRNIRVAQGYTSFKCDISCENCPSKQYYCVEYKYAEALYNAGYRKLPKDSVVLSREEYELLANKYKNLEIKYSNLCDNYRLCKDANETLKQHIIVTCKKTAEKILNDLVKNCQYTFNIDGKSIVELDGDFILNAAKSYGVKIKE